MHVETLPINSDLTPSSFVDAVDRLRVAPNETTLFCSTDYSCSAWKIAEEYTCLVIIVPKELIQRDHWAVTTRDSMVWSPGA
jgi:hypothetical protein